MQSGLLQREPLPGRSASQHSSPTPSVASRITAHAVASPAKPAIVDGNLSITFADLETRSNQLANYLWEAGAGPESCIAILMDRSAQFVIAALAVLKTGAAYLPLDPSTPLDRTEFILADASAKLLLTHRRKSRRPQSRPMQHYRTRRCRRLSHRRPADHPRTRPTRSIQPGVRHLHLRFHRPPQRR